MSPEMAAAECLLFHELDTNIAIGVLPPVYDGWNTDVRRSGQSFGLKRLKAQCPHSHIQSRRTTHESFQ
jgi:hypothetical protein